MRYVKQKEKEKNRMIVQEKDEMKFMKDNITQIKALALMYVGAHI